MPASCSQHPKQTGFTLLEVLVAISLMLAVSALVLKTVIVYYNDSFTQKAETKIQQLAVELESYRQINGNYFNYDITTVSMPATGSEIYSIKILDPVTGLLLTDPASSKQQWVIIATSTSADYPSLFVNNFGVRCTNTDPLQITLSSCGSNAISW